MRRVIIRHPKAILFDAIIDAFGKIYIKECIDSIYLKTIEYVVNGEYELEFEDGIFKINERSVFKNLEKLKENPLYKDRLEIKKINYKDILEYTNQNKPPIDLQTICDFFKINVQKIDSLPYDGLSKYENGKYYIFYKSGIKSPYRERFTIAHELGHIFLHFSEDKTTFTDETINRKLKRLNQKAAARGLEYLSNIQLEREANNFAANLLMPSNLIIEYFYKYKWDIELLSDTFRTSKEAIQHRLRNIGIIPNY